MPVIGSVAGSLQRISADTAGNAPANAGALPGIVPDGGILK
jgi:hypothetical protein